MLFQSLVRPEAKATAVGKLVSAGVPLDEALALSGID